MSNTAANPSPDFKPKSTNGLVQSDRPGRFFVFGALVGHNGQEHFHARGDFFDSMFDLYIHISGLWERTESNLAFAIVMIEDTGEKGQHHQYRHDVSKRNPTLLDPGMAEKFIKRLGNDWTGIELLREVGFADPYFPN